MNLGYYAAIAQFGLCVITSIGYFIVRDWRHGLYWFFCACISAVITWGMK